MAKYVYGNTLVAFETAKSSDVIAEFQKIETMSATEETRANDAIKFPAGEGNDIRIVENAAQRIDKVLMFDSAGDLVLKSVGDASIIVDAGDLPITDVGGHYIGENVEAALQENGDSIEQLTNADSKKNYLINPTFSINQRVFAGGALADGVYGYDRWKAGGASNVTLSGVIATIVSGTLVQVVEDFGYTGSVTVSWAGTATVNGSNTSPYTYTKIAGNDTLTFSTGTLSEVKLEIGSKGTPFEYPDIVSESLKCQRYYYAAIGVYNLYTHTDGISTLRRYSSPRAIEMMTTPTENATNGGSGTLTFSGDANTINVNANSVTSGLSARAVDYTAESEL